MTQANNAIAAPSAESAFNILDINTTWDIGRDIDLYVWEPGGNPISVDDSNMEKPIVTQEEMDLKDTLLTASNLYLGRFEVMKIYFSIRPVLVKFSIRFALLIRKLI